MASIAGAFAIDAAAQGTSAEVSVFAAGSLRAALTDMAKEWEAANPNMHVRFTFGASGLLKDRLAQGERADVFASANMEHPQALQQAGRAEGVLRFATNTMCVIVRPGLDVTADNLIQHMLDPAVKLGTSTPGADPSGDYAWEQFRRVERAGTPGAFTVLSEKALQLTGGPQSPLPPPDRNIYAALVGQGAADIFITYCTNATLAIRENPSLRSVKVPASIDVAASYGVAVLRDASPRAASFVDHMLSAPGQAVLMRYGFSAR